jgi:hypothetical protein
VSGTRTNVSGNRTSVSGTRTSVSGSGSGKDLKGPSSLQHPQNESLAPTIAIEKVICYVRGYNLGIKSYFQKLSSFDGGAICNRQVAAKRGRFSEGIAFSDVELNRE